MKSGSTSSDRQADTHAPQWMHAIDWVMSIMDCGSTTYSRSGGSPSGSSHGTIRWTFFQWTASMSTIRSLMTGMLPIGSTVMRPSGSCESSDALASLVLHASDDLPLILTPQEPQIAAWHEQRIASDPSWSPFAWRIPSSTERSGSRSTSNSCQYGASPDSGSKRRTRRVKVSAAISVLPFLGFPAGHRDLRVRHLGRQVAVDLEVDVLEPLAVVALGEVGAVLRAAALLALQRRGDHAL